MNSDLSEAEYFSQPHVHTSEDGRGQRRVLIDGVEIRPVSFADTEIGIAVVTYQPARVAPGTEYIDQYVVLGDVQVEPVVS